MPMWLRHHLLIIVLAAPILFFRLGAARLWDRDEPRNARCAVEMIERNDWVIPFFNDELRTHKPVLLYWLIMSAYGVFGVNEFAARFWSAALGLGTIFCTYHLGARLFNRSTGLWSALALAPALMFDVASRAATPDAPLIFFVTASLLAYVCWTFTASEKATEPRFPRGWIAGVVVYALMALAVLAKGPVGIVLPVAIIGASLWASRFLSANDATASVRLCGFHPRSLLALVWEMRPVTALAMLLILAVPWYAWVGYRTNGEFLFGFFWDHNVRRATETMEGHQGPALIFYPITLLVGFFPASVFLIPSLLESWKSLCANHPKRNAILFCLTWIIVVVGLFSLAKTKLPSYVTPCYPALALLVGNLLHRWTSGQLVISPVWLRVAIASNIVIGVAVMGGIYAATDRYLPGEQWLSVIGVVLVLGGIAAVICEFALSSSAQAAAATSAAGLIFSLLLFGLGPTAADRHQQSHLLLAAVRSGDDGDVAAAGCLEPSWVFYLQRPILEIPQPQEAAAFLSAASDRYVILRERDYLALEGQLPDDVEIFARAPLFLKADTLLVVGRGHSVARRPPDSAAANR